VTWIWEGVAVSRTAAQLKRQMKILRKGFLILAAAGVDLGRGWKQDETKHQKKIPRQAEEVVS
jgi:hypothetical protein